MEKLIFRNKKKQHKNEKAPNYRTYMWIEEKVVEKGKKSKRERN